MLERKVESAISEESVGCGKFCAYQKKRLKKGKCQSVWLVAVVVGQFSLKKEGRKEGRKDMSCALIGKYYAKKNQPNKKKEG